MIGYLNGKILDVQQGNLIVLVGGIGYKVFADTSRYLGGEEVELFIHTAMRENELSLWGFANKHDLILFDLLLQVSGVGLKTAQALIMNIGSENIKNAIASGNEGALKAPGVGAKTAQRIIIDLKDKISALGISTMSETESTSESGDFLEDVITALVSLGYNRNEVRTIVLGLDRKKFTDAESMIKHILLRI